MNEQSPVSCSSLLLTPSALTTHDLLHPCGYAHACMCCPQTPVAHLHVPPSKCVSSCATSCSMCPAATTNITAALTAAHLVPPLGVLLQKLLVRKQLLRDALYHVQPVNAKHYLRKWRLEIGGLDRWSTPNTICIIARKRGITSVTPFHERTMLEWIGES